VLRNRNILDTVGGYRGAMQGIHPKGRVADTHSKALSINLDTRRYGTFAEIGAGQEVVRWFFLAGARPAPSPRACPPTT